MTQGVPAAAAVLHARGPAAAAQPQPQPQPPQQQAPAPAPAYVRVPAAAQMRMLGMRLAALLRPGDLVVLTGPLGAGKTTLVQGLGEGLGVRGPVTSPTFVIARMHPSLCGGPALVHADAYRLGSRGELDDLDLDTDLDSSVTVVEWGEGLAEDLASSFLEIRITRPPRAASPEAPPARAALVASPDARLAASPAPAAASPDARLAAPAAALADPGDEARIVSIVGRGDRWEVAAAASALRALTDAPQVP